MILIVDDKRENIVPLIKILDLHNLQADSAESGEEALRMILKKSYSLIIMDVQMPGMDGFEVAEALSGSNRTKDIPVIFLSAISKEKKYISKGYETGAVDYITKPVDPDLLILKVKTFLKLYEQKNELKDIRDLLSKEIEIRKEAQENLELKVAERTKELSEKNEELEMRNHELQQFAWVVSHDLKEPLRKIETFIKIIKERYLVRDEKAVDYVNRTVRSSQRMGKLITDLLDYSRLSSDVLPETVVLNDVLQEVLSDFDHLVEQKEAQIKIDNLPNITGVPSQLRQLFQNLIGNSLKFTKPDTIPQITITAERINDKDFNSPVTALGNYCRIIVADNGIGFNELYLDKIFKIFQSLNDRNSYEGTGIGLAIAKKIVEKHNGIITAKSHDGNGASFIIILPV
ncbi:histidine kinase [Flavobacterium rivuli WB 3.3-2 = DSM 21788]|uniref:histidine kinase n=1 Tax=Flavobacterium rivuli WB 3.3-2 = DSM 21788 TaxID=1121895 RepID=A0A0A2MD62_9FLAO|nr:response regulator [Flavobacterium rivuli]KGO86215.1 histidine kinase [Flavobacterium rivuli WB 3.3-2 = DSM 21788]